MEEAEETISWLEIVEESDLLPKSSVEKNQERDLGYTFHRGRIPKNCKGKYPKAQ